MLAAAAGILFGVCNVAVKALSGMVGDHGLIGLASPALVVAGLASAAAFYASARSLQDGEAVEVIAITGTAANIAGIAGGIIVFGDPMPGTALGIAVQAVAFVMVVVASALTPGAGPLGRARRVPGLAALRTGSARTARPSGAPFAVSANVSGQSPLRRAYSKR